MYYLSKFCRICIKTDVKLLDLDTLDFDEVKLSEKLEVCTKMVVSRESLSTEICVHCIAKLRISYQFHDMCKKSTNTLQGYLQALLCTSDDQINPKNFERTELNVIVRPIAGNLYNFSSHNSVDDGIHGHREKRKRITKEQRCSLLKRLLTPTEKYKKERDKLTYRRNIYLNDYRGGLKNIIHFTRNYEFGLSVDKNSNYESTPLDKLTAFSNEFFRKDFSEFRNTILYIIENKDSLCESDGTDDDDSDYFCSPDEDEDTSDGVVKFEEVIVEPDIKIKTEIDYEEEGECGYNFDEPYLDITCKKEMDIQDVKIEASTEHHCPVLPIPMPSNYSEYIQSFGYIGPSNSSVHLLDRLVGGYGQRRTFSQNNVRCRTRDNPYINPLLKDQFLYRSFKCEKCNRYFKSPGYLKAHYSKVH